MGLHLDSRPINQPKGTWSDARNVVKSRTPGATVNEPGNIEVATNYPIDAVYVGSITFPNEDILVFSAGTTPRIGIIEGETYRDIFVDSILGFSINFPVFGVFRFNSLQERVVAFTDGNNTPKEINIDNLPFQVNSSLGLINQDDINDIEVFPSSNPPLIEFSVNDSGGNLSSGTYFVSARYENRDGTETNYHDVIGPIYINDDASTLNFEDSDGVEAGTTTAKSIEFTVSNLDTRFDRLVLGIIQVENGVVSARQVRSISIGGSSVTLVYNGAETSTTLTLENVTIPSPKYTSAKAISQLKDRLYLGNLKTEPSLDLQDFANGIIVNYTTKLLDAKTLEGSHKDNADKGFIHGEVYALYIGAELNNGSFTRGFHIPGRIVTDTERLPSATVTNAGIPGVVQRYKVIDTTNSNNQTYALSAVVNGVVFPTRPIQKNVSNMGAWENLNEVYPDNFPDFAGQNVRHHRFPTTSECKSRHYSSDNDYGISTLDVLGIDLEFTRALTAEQKSQIKAIRLFYAKPSIANNLVIAQDIALSSGGSPFDPDIIWSSGGNWWVNTGEGGSSNEDLFADISPTGVVNSASPIRYLRNHSFDLLRNRPAVNVSYVRSEYGLSIANLSNNSNVIINNAAYRGEAGTPLLLLDYTKDVDITTSAIAEANSIQGVDFLRYLPQNVIDGNFYNLNCEETVLIKLTESSTDSDIRTINRTTNLHSGNSQNAQIVTGARNQVDTILYTICSIKDDVYNSYQDQLLIATDKILIDLDATSLNDVYGGDAYISNASYITKGAGKGNSFIQNDGGVHTIWNFICESRNNINFRHETSDTNTKYFPKTPASGFVTNPNSDQAAIIIRISEGGIFNNFQYNGDYSLLNEYNSIFPAKEDDEDITEFPFRVIRSIATALEDVVTWRRFLPTDYYEQNRNRGEITNIDFIDDILLIHHKYGLFRTIGSETLRTTTLEVTLGSGNIFQNEPKEPISTKDGYLGCQDPHSAFVCKLGYVWTDGNQGKVFILSMSEGIREISNIDIRNFLQDNINETVGNPLISNGISMCFDEYNRRILLSYKTSSSFTLSYSYKDDEWVCFHDYLPNRLFNTRNKVYSTFNNRIYKHNSSNKAEFYGQVYSSFVELVYNTEPIYDKIIESIAWITEIEDQGIISKNDTFNSIRVRNSYQDTGEIELRNFSNIRLPFNVRREHNSWLFNQLRSGTGKDRLIDKYFKIKLSYNNDKSLDNTQKTLYLYDVSILSQKILS